MFDSGGGPSWSNPLAFIYTCMLVGKSDNNWVPKMFRCFEWHEKTTLYYDCNYRWRFYEFVWRWEQLCSPTMIPQVVNLRSESLKFAWGWFISSRHNLRMNINHVLQRECKGNGVTLVLPTLEKGLYKRKNWYTVKPLPCDEKIPILYPVPFIKVRRRMW